MYNVSTNSWKVTTPMPTPRQAAGFAVDPVQARAFVVGGNGVSIFAHLEPGDPRVALAAVHFFDAHDQSWTALQGLPHGVYAPGVAVFNNTLYVFGGMDNFLNPVSDVWALPLDQPGASWVAKSSMPLEIGGFSLAALDDNIYVLGGAAGSSNSRHYVAKTMVYNVPNNSWVTLQADMPTPVVYAGAALGANSTIVVVGGGKQDSQNVVAVDVVQQYLPSQDKYQTLASLYGARNCVSAAQFSDQFIFTVGGFGVGATAQTTNGNNLLRDVDMYDFVSKRWSTRAPLPLPRANGALVVM